ncbi:MAG: hypothetical protein ACYC4L_17065 [Chloroflexota bacterium]
MVVVARRKIEQAVDNSGRIPDEIWAQIESWLSHVPSGRRCP